MKKEKSLTRSVIKHAPSSQAHMSGPAVAAVAAVSILVLLSPQFLSNYRLNLIVSILTTAYLAQCWNLMSGLAGQFSFGHAAFFGLGAYTSSLLYSDFGVTPWIGMFAGMAVAGIVGSFIGLLSFRYRLRGDYFALATLAFAEILRVIANNTEALHAAQGIMIDYSRDISVMQFPSRAGYVYMAFIMLALITFLIFKLHRSRTGLYFVAIRENEDAAGALGINAFKYKMLALVMSAMLTALAGTFYAQYYKFVDPTIAFGSTVSINAIIPCIVGGVGTIFGPILGAAIIEPISELTNAYLSAFAGMNMVVYGIILATVIILMPKGVDGLIRSIAEKFAAKHTAALEVTKGERTDGAADSI